MEIVPLSKALGVEIKGVDVSDDMPAGLCEEIRNAWLTHKVVVFRNQKLTEEGQLRFANLFGEIQAVRSADHIVGEAQAFMYVANRSVNGKPGILPDGEMYFHNDQSYYEVPSKASLLYALEIPAKGGNTLFSNAVAAYAMLAEKEKEELIGLQVFNVYDYDRNPTAPSDTYNPEAPHYVHPLVIKHPETGQPALFVSRLMSHHIQGMDHAKSDILLNRLFDHIENQAFRYEHVWQLGDLVMWDNFATQHARTHFDPAERRVMRRVGIAGHCPVGYEVAA